MAQNFRGRNSKLIGFSSAQCTKTSLLTLGLN
jgi:hypothetical protein